MITVASQGAGLEGSGISRQNDRCDLRPGVAGALLPPVCSEFGEGCVIDRRDFGAEHLEVCLERLKKKFTAGYLFLLGYKVGNTRPFQ